MPEEGAEADRSSRALANEAIELIRFTLRCELITMIMSMAIKSWISKLDREEGAHAGTYTWLFVGLSSGVALAGTLN